MDRNSLAPRNLVPLLVLLAGLPLAACSDDTNPPIVEPDQGPPIDSTVDQKPQPDGTGTDGAIVHKPLTVTIAHVNDTHSQIEQTTPSLTFKYNNVSEKIGVPTGGYARIAAKVKALRQKVQNFLFVHAGDAVTGSLYFVKYLGIADADFFNLMKLDAQALGNHEFDKGSKVLADYASKATYPLVGGNVDASQDPLLKDKIKPYVIKTVGGELVGIASLITPETPAISSPDPNVKFGDMVIEARALVGELERRGVNKIIFLTHLYYDKDKELAKAVDGIDVIVGGHSHTLLGTFGLGVTPEAPYPFEAKSPNGSKVCVVTAGTGAQVLGTLEVAFDAAGAVQSCGGKATMLIGDAFTQFNTTTFKTEPVPADKKAELMKQLTADFEVVAEDADAVTKLNTDYKPQVDALKSQKVATVPEDLLHVRVPGMKHTTTGTVLANGSEVAPLICEAMLWKTSLLPEKAQIALTNAGGVRGDILKGDLTLGTIWNLFFGNTLFLVKLTGDELRKTLDAAVAKATETGSKGGPFPYVAGIRYTADLNKPVGQLITSLELQSGTSWQNIDAATTYSLVTSKFVADGGDYYTTLKSLTYRKDLGYVDADVFADWAAMKSTVSKTAASVTLIPKTP